MKKKKKPKETLQTCPFKEELTRINQVTWENIITRKQIMNKLQIPREKKN
jgi:hypothetical protein